MLGLAKVDLPFEVVMETAVERRSARRFAMNLPLTVRYASQEGPVERQGSTRDVSFRGLYFLMDALVDPDAPIEFVLTLPKEITLAGDVHIRCYGRVVRVERHNGRCGVAALIERYEFLDSPA